MSYFLKASLTLSPACLRFPLAWSVWPSASSSWSSVASPTPSLTLPLTSVALWAALSSVAMVQHAPSGFLFHFPARGGQTGLPGGKKRPHGRDHHGHVGGAGQLP